MTKLLVEEDGVRRSFKVGDGVLVIGAAEGIALRLSSPDVADEHAELDVRGKRVFLRARPGVLPPKVGGESISGEFELAPGDQIEIGAATILVEFEGTPRPPVAKGPASPGAAQRPTPVMRGGQDRTPVHTQGGSGKGSRSGGRARSKSGSARPGTRPGRRRGSKRASWVGPAIFLGVLVAIAIFAGVIVPALLGDSEPNFEPRITYNHALRALNSGQPEAALKELDSLPDEVLVDAALALQIEQMRVDIDRAIATREERVHNDLGDVFLKEQLKRFEREHLQGRAERPAVRLFLTRLEEFEQRWPAHSELPWARRMRERFSRGVSLSEPPGFEDVAFAVRLLDRADPRDFGQTIELLEEFIASASSEDRALAAELLEVQLAARQEWFTDKLEQAHTQYDSGEPGRAFAWLVRIVLYTGDPVMAAEGAERLVKFSDIDERLRGYRRGSSAEFERLARHATIRDYLTEHPLD